MRILIDTFNSAASQTAGIGTYARVLTHANHRLGHDVSLLTDDRAGRGPQIPEAPWYIRNRFYSIRGLATKLSLSSGTVPIQSVANSSLADPSQMRRRLGHFDRTLNGSDLLWRALARFHKTRRPTLIDLPLDIDVAHFTWCLPIRIRNAKKNIYTLHDLIPLRFPHLTLDDKAAYHELVSWCCRTGDLIVTVSEHSRREIVDLLGVPPARVINTFQSLDPHRDSRHADDITSSLRSLFGLAYGQYFLLAGAIEPRKNVAMAIEAHLTAVTDFPLVICGPKTALSQGELKRLDVRRQIQWPSPPAKTRVLGYLPRHHLEMLIIGARAVLVPSITEGFGLVALEALSAGTPVIASRAGALPEVCGSAAMYVDPYDAPDLRRAIDRVAALSANELAELKSRSFAQAKRFSFETYCARLSELYSSLLRPTLARGHEESRAI